MAQCHINSMSLLHPLAEPSLRFTNHRNEAAIDFNDPQPVLLSGNIYMKGLRSPKGHLRLWKYDSAGMFSDLPCPSACNNQTEDDRYLLTSFKSQLLLIHAHFTWPNTEFPNQDEFFELDPDDFDDIQKFCHELELRSYKLLETESDKGRHMHTLKCTDPLYAVGGSDEIYCPEYRSFLRENRARDPEHWDVSITSNDDYLFVAFVRRDKYKEYLNQWESETFGYGPHINAQVLIFDENHGFVCSVNGPSLNDNEDSKICKPMILVHDDNFYMKLWTNFKKENFQKASLKSLTDKSSTYVAWCQSHSIPESSSNLTLLEKQPVIGLVSTENESPLYLCALTSCKSGDTWVEIACFDCQFDPAPIVVGVPDGSKLIVIGMIKDDSKSCEELHVLEAIPQVAAYDPDRYLTLDAINKLQVGASINLLPVLEKSLESLSDLQRLAGFDLSESIEPFYSKNSMIPKYINKWTACGDRSRRPTWKNFLSILRELKEVSVAEQIERYLKETTADVNNSQILKSFEATGSEEVGFLKTQLESLYHDLDKEVAVSVEVKKRVKGCVDQSQVAFDKLRLERRGYLDSLEKQTCENKKIKEALEALEQQANIGPPPTKRARTLSETKDRASAAEQMHMQCQQRETPTLKLLLEELLSKMASKWENIGALLGVDDGYLSSIKADNRGDSGDCLREMLRIWLKKADTPPSWNDIVEALEHLGEKQLAQKLKQRHC